MHVCCHPLAIAALAMSLLTYTVPGFRLISSASQVMPELLISTACNVVWAQMFTFTHTYSFLAFYVYIVISGSVERFSYRFMLHASLIVVRLHALIGSAPPCSHKIEQCELFHHTAQTSIVW